jgi:citrate lyase subunit beta/citryl-CoA lyase
MWAEIKDLDGLRAFAAQGRGLGYEGMVAIHPSHVAIINEAFTPSAAELDADAALVAAMEEGAAAGRGAVVFDGNMIDEAMAATARRRLARYRG